MQATVGGEKISTVLQSTSYEDYPEKPLMDKRPLLLLFLQLLFTFPHCKRSRARNISYECTETVYE